MTKKIEPGCRCVIVNSEAGNEGVVVTVKRNLGIVPGVKTNFGDRWEIDGLVNSTTNTPINNVGEYQLKPIDEDNDEAFERFKLACGIGEGVVA